jgi:hypothetical protein
MSLLMLTVRRKEKSATPATKPLDLTRPLSVTLTHIYNIFQIVSLISSSHPHRLGPTNASPDVQKTIDRLIPSALEGSFILSVEPTLGQLECRSRTSKKAFRRDEKSTSNPTRMISERFRLTSHVFSLFSFFYFTSIAYFPFPPPHFLPRSQQQSSPT